MSAHRPVIMARDFAIAAGHYLATAAGYEILADGGNAVDAGVAAGITMGVVQSDLVNFAGVAPIMLRMAGTGEVVNIDGLGTWPKAVTPDLFVREHGGLIPEGLLRTVVPAAPDAWLTALERFGTRTFAEVAASAIAHARDGFAIDPWMVEYITNHADGHARWPSNRAIYLPGGRPPSAGARFVQRDLAATLQYMVDEESAQAARGREAGIAAARDAFYRGDIARRIVDYHRDHGGLLSADDLAAYRVRFEPSAVGHYAGYEVHCCGPWSQGPALAQVLTLLGHIDLEALGHNSVAYVHTVAEALKLCFADRERYVADPAFVDVPLADLLSKPYLAARRTLIREDRAWPDLPPAGDPRQGAAVTPDRAESASSSASWAPMVDPHDTRPATGGSIGASVGDTSYVCVVDAEGNAFSATPSDVSCDTPVIPGTGLSPSSRGCQSRPDPDHPASVAPGKRPRLTPNPALALKDGRTAMVFGTPGGDVQVQAMTQFFVNAVTFGMDVQGAIEAPRFASYSFPSSFAPHASEPGLLAVEARVGEGVIASLAALGHRVERWPAWTRKAGSVCAIHIDPETAVKHAGADPRRAGYAMGR